MAKRLSEINNEAAINYFTEYQRIDALFSKNKYIGKQDYLIRTSPFYSLEEFFNGNLFSRWHLRGRYVTIIDMRQCLNIDDLSMQKKFTNEKLLLYIQVVINAVILIESKKQDYPIYFSDEYIIDNIKSNCDFILSSLNYKFEYDANNKELYIIECDAKATAVGETLPDISDKVLEYRRFELKGNLQRKGEILCSLYKKLESTKGNLAKTTYAQLVKDTAFLFNTTGARHWVEKDKIASQTFLKMQPAELELWYDRTYDLFLSCMIMSNYIEIEQEIKAIKQID
jgi:hypothetical protein